VITGRQEWSFEGSEKEGKQGTTAHETGSGMCTTRKHVRFFRRQSSGGDSAVLAFVFLRTAPTLAAVSGERMVGIVRVWDVVAKNPPWVCRGAHATDHHALRFPRQQDIGAIHAARSFCAFGHGKTAQGAGRLSEASAALEFAPTASV